MCFRLRASKGVIFNGTRSIVDPPQVTKSTESKFLHDVDIMLFEQLYSTTLEPRAKQRSSKHDQSIKHDLQNNMEQNGVSLSNQASKHSISNMSCEFLSMEPKKWSLSPKWNSKLSYHKLSIKIAFQYPMSLTMQMFGIIQLELFLLGNKPLIPNIASQLALNSIDPKCKFSLLKWLSQIAHNWVFTLDYFPQYGITNSQILVTCDKNDNHVIKTHVLAQPYAIRWNPPKIVMEY